MKIKLAAAIVVLGIMILGLTGCIVRATLSPPEWLIGTWCDSYAIRGLVVTTDDVVIVTGAIRMSLIEAFSVPFVRMYDRVRGNNGNNVYTITISKVFGAVTTVYKFTERQAGMSLYFSETVSGTSLPQITLHRQKETPPED